MAFYLAKTIIVSPPKTRTEKSLFIVEKSNLGILANFVFNE
jgi:hypothetical protein